MPQTKKEIAEDALHFLFLAVKQKARERGAAFTSEMGAQETGREMGV
jgi:hypothetical protein